MELQRKATIWGLVLAAFAPLMVLLFPTKVGDAFVCAADHVVHLVTAGGSPHLWSHFQWTALCLWVLSVLATVIAGLGLLGVWTQAQARKRSRPGPTNIG